MELLVIKRNHKKESYQPEKIALAIKKGFDNTANAAYSHKDVAFIYHNVIMMVLEKADKKGQIHIETIQDTIEKQLLKYNYHDVYEIFNNYRLRRQESRNLLLSKQHQYLKVIESLDQQSIEQINKQTLVEFGLNFSKAYTKEQLLPPEINQALEMGLLDIYGLAYYQLGSLVSFNIDCLQLKEPLLTTLENLVHEVTYQIHLYHFIDALHVKWLNLFKTNIKNLLEDASFLLAKPLMNASLQRKINQIKSLEVDIAPLTNHNISSELMMTIIDLAKSKAFDSIEELCLEFMEKFKAGRLPFTIIFYDSLEQDEVISQLRQFFEETVDLIKPDEKSLLNQGVLSLVSINTLRLAKNSAEQQLIFDSDHFKHELVKLVNLALNTIYEQIQYQWSLKPKQLPTLMEKQLYRGSEKLNESDNLKRILKMPQAHLNLINWDKTKTLLLKHGLKKKRLEAFDKLIAETVALFNQAKKIQISLLQQPMPDIEQKMMALDTIIFSEGDLENDET